MVVDDNAVMIDNIFLNLKNIFLSRTWKYVSISSILIHENDPQSQPVVITVFARGVRTSVPTFQNLAKQNKFQARIVITIDEDYGSCDSGWVDHWWQECLVSVLFHLTLEAKLWHMPSKKWEDKKKE